jgi:uncharacterized protein YdbL (DUF1318 family)|tara:strand:- start:29 stop:418 length:390 start_codon:yes stop_codon:yes gene_type:complete
MSYTYDDGGRSLAGYKGITGDCAARAMVIALDIDYRAAYKEIALANKAMGFSKSARNGVHKNIFQNILKKHGWSWHSAPKFTGRKAYHYDMPPGKVIARMARHYCTVINKEIHDSWDSSDKMIYGYWAK